MASQGTPINQLPQQNDDDKQFVQNIINQMQNDNQEAEQAYQQTQQQYQQQQFAVNQQQQHMQNQQMQQQYQDQDEDVEYEETEEIVKPEVRESLMQSLKMPLIFVGLFILLSIPFVRQFAAAQVNRFTGNESAVLYGSILLLGVVGGVIFFASNKFL